MALVLRRVLIAALGLGLAAVLSSPTLAQRGGGGDGQGGFPFPGGGFQGGGLPGGRFGGPPRDTAEQPTGSAVIRGRILAADSGAPVRRAQVRAVASDLRVARLASTDTQGKFELKDLPAGRWTLTASKAGYVTLQYGQKRPFESGQPLTLSDTEVLERADFALPRASAVTGHVFDEFGEPVANARVQVMRYQTVQGQRRLIPAGGGDQSDDTGAFRVYGLAPGDYYISATLRAGLGFGDSTDNISYAPTFYPGTGNVAEAQRVTLALGQEQGNINFALLPIRAVHVTGTALDSSGTPLVNGMVVLTGGSEMAGAFPIPASGGRTRPDGTFTLTNVAPGSYLLNASSGAPRRGNTDIEVASIPIVVGNDDLSGITVITSKGATLSGTVVTAEGTSGQLRTNGIQVVAQALRFDAGPFGGATRPARLEADASFQLTNLMGSRVIRVNGLPQDWTLKAVMMGSTDVTDSAMDFKGSEQITGVQIVVTDRVTEVNGKVTVRGEPTRDYTVVVFPDDQSKWTFPSRYLRSGRADQQGLFKIRALPPDAHYLAVAVDYLEEGEGSDPQFLEQMKQSATRFALADGESKALDLKLMTR